MIVNSLLLLPMAYSTYYRPSLTAVANGPLEGRGEWSGEREKEYLHLTRPDF